MQTRVGQRLNEGQSGPVYYPVLEITAALNEANRFFCLLTLGLETTAAWDVPPAIPTFRMLQVFPDWTVCLRITTPTGLKIRPARLQDLGALNGSWLNSPGAPERYAVVGSDMLALYKQPADVGTVLNITYANTPAVLNVAADTPAIPAEYHPALVDYAIYRLRQGEGAQEFAKSMKYFEAFLVKASKYGDYVRARNIGNRYDVLPYEIKAFDRSQLLKLRKDLFPAMRASDT